MKPAKSNGIVSSFFAYTSSPQHDEIDFEFLGKDTTKVQLNYFVTGVGGHEHLVDLGFDASLDFHVYGFIWSESKITWYVDGAEVYSVTGPQTTLPSNASNVFLNLWNGIGVDSWLNPFIYSTPLTAGYDSVLVSQ